MKNYIISIINPKLNLVSKLFGYLLTASLFVAISILPAETLAKTSNISDLKPWSILLYCGGTANQTFGKVIRGKYSSFGELIYAAELAYTLDKNNLIRRFFSPIFDIVQLAGNVALRHDYRRHDNVKEGNLYLIWRFTRFPWSNYLRNSVAIGDGISYDSHPPYANMEPGKPASDFSKLINYLLLEVTFALPAHPEFELSLRMHHSCTAWGTFPKNPNAGSTNVGIGFRYYFKI